MTENKYNLSKSNLNPNLERFKYEVAQELGISQRKDLNDKKSGLEKEKRL